MKRLITSVLLLSALCCNLAFAQTTISSTSNLPKLGDVLIWEGQNADSINVTATGPGLTWNFANLGPSAQPYTQKATMVVPSTTVEGDSFPNSNICGKDTTGLYIYFNIIPTEYALHGTVAGTPGGPLVIAYSDPEIIYALPFGYSSTSTDSYSGTFKGGTVQFYRTGTTTATGDATGTLITAAGTFQNVLRVKRVEMNKDSSDLFGTPFVTNTVNTTYEWYSQWNRGALFSYTATSNNGGAPVYSAQYLKSAAVGIAPQSAFTSAMSFYPNPVSGSGEFTYALAERAAVNISLYDIMGKEVKMLQNEVVEAGSHSLPVNTAGLPSGIYYIKTIASGQVAQYKISVL